MIIRPDGEAWILISQPDHATLSGEMAVRWGNDRFMRPEPWEAVTRGIYRHDNGWEEWDARPHVDAETGIPYVFTNTPVEEYLDVWRRGIARMLAEDSYAGLLVGRHGTRLVGRRLARAADPPEVLAELHRFVTETEARARAVKSQQMSDAGWSEADEARLEANYALLRTCDTLSLLCCCGPPAPSAIDDAPTGAVPDRLRLQITPLDARTLTLDPYPFDTPDFTLAVPGRRIPRRPYRTHEELWAALAEGETVELEFRMRIAS